MKKKSDFFLSENFHCLVVKCLVYLNKHIFVMSGIIFWDQECKMTPTMRQVSLGHVRTTKAQFTLCNRALNYRLLLSDCCFH